MQKQQLAPTNGSSITVSPPSGGRSGELTPPPPALLLSPSLYLAPVGCYAMKPERD